MEEKLEDEHHVNDAEQRISSGPRRLMVMQIFVEGTADH
jgi:hypothetical protein